MSFNVVLKYLALKKNASLGSAFFLFFFFVQPVGFQSLQNCARSGSAFVLATMHLGQLLRNRLRVAPHITGLSFARSPWSSTMSKKTFILSGMSFSTGCFYIQLTCHDMYKCT